MANDPLEEGAVGSVDFLRLAERAKEVLGSGGHTWLTTPKRFLGGVTPLAFAGTEAGAQEVMQALGRLEHGVFL